MRPLTAGTGLWPGGGETLRWDCAECGWQGTPLVFSSAEEQVAYRRARSPAWREEADAEAASPAPAGEPSAAAPDRAVRWGALLAVASGFLILVLGVVGLLVNAGEGNPRLNAVVVPGFLVGLGFIAMGWKRLRRPATEPASA